MLIIVVLCASVGYIVSNQASSAILNQKEYFLQGYAKQLDARLEAGGYDAILLRHKATNASDEEKIRILNKELAPATDEIGDSLDTLGIGFYSRELDAIVTYGPSSKFGDFVGRAIGLDHPGRKVMATNTQNTSFGSMVRGDIMNAMRPISRNGLVIGYIWANQTLADVQESTEAITNRIAVILFLCAILSGCVFSLLLRRTSHSIDSLVNGVRTLQQDISRRIPPLNNEMKDVALSINSMADEVQRSNKKIYETAQTLQTVMDNVDAVIYVCDAKTYEILFLNSYAKNLHGGINTTGRCYKSLMLRDDPCPDCPAKLLDKETPDAIVSREVHRKQFNRDFFARWRIIRWNNYRDALMMVATDITDRKALEVAAATNLAQKSFLERMSHELRTPVDSVLDLTHSALLADAPQLHLDYLKKIDSSASRLLGIINNILDYSRIEAQKMEIEKRVFDLHAALQNIRNLTLPHVEARNNELVFEQKNNLPRFVKGDEQRLSQVLLNLVDNAAKFTSNGTISLSAEAYTQQPGSKILLRCAVRDTGTGMTEEQMGRIFQPFAQTDISDRQEPIGTGLGLAICKALVELMNGKISASSIPGQGSEFSFLVLLDSVKTNENTAEDGPPNT
jgi:signal transduction histidine kinase